MKKTLRFAAWFGIVYLIALIFTVIFAVVKHFNPDDSTWTVTAIIAECICTILFSIIMYSFYLLGKYAKNRLLRIASILTMLLEIISLPFAILFEIHQPDPVYTITYFLIVIFLTGIVMLMMGISLLRLNDRLKGLATSFGVLMIIAGASFMTIVFFFIGIVLLIPIYIMIPILFLKASKQY